jgi:uncharacterized membrane protein
MTNPVIRLLLWFSAIGCGLMAGVYFAFSTFIMTALGRIEPVHAIAAMNSISATILRSLFMPLFLGTTAAGAALVIFGVLRRSEPGATAMLVGGLVYIAGMFLCTVFFNVPLNNALASAADPPMWARYLREWTMWNHVRTISSAAAFGLYIRAIAAT